VVLSRGEGVWLWDDQGRRYLDMLSAYSAVSFGYGHPRLLAALNDQARRLAVTSRAFFNDRLPPFLARLCEVSGMDRALPMSTGAEGVETAIKCARKWAYVVKKVPDGQAKIVTCAGNFHGRTSTIVGFSSESQYREGFGPYTDGFRSVAFGDAAALEAAITPDTAAFLVEPVQGEAGIIVPPAGYLTEAQRICRKHNVLLIVDEVQTGLGRTGRILACHHEGVEPDAIILGKALGGGLLPVSAFVAREAVMGVFKPGDHGSTFGGNALGAAVGLEALNVLVDEKLAERAATMGAYLLQRLRTIASPMIVEVRGKGLLIGLEIDTKRATARQFVETLLKHGVLSKDTHGTVARFAPPLVIDREQIDWGVERIRDALREYGPVYEKAA
jgi:ornithine--oxo-acid transaminase